MIGQLSMEFQSLIAMVLSGLSTVLGLAVGYIALRAYLQSRSRPMLFIAVGFVLVFWGPLLLVTGWLITPAEEFLFGVLGELSRVLGLGSILYGLWTPRSRSPSKDGNGQ